MLHVLHDLGSYLGADISYSLHATDCLSYAQSQDCTTNQTTTNSVKNLIRHSLITQQFDILNSKSPTQSLCQ